MNGSLADHRHDATADRVADLPPATELRTRGQAIELELDGAVAKVIVGGSTTPTQIEISTAGAIADEYFVATFDGARLGALVRLNEHYDRVTETDLKLMVGVERDVAGFPSIALTGDPERRRVGIVARGLTTRIELVPFPADPEQH